MLKRSKIADLLSLDKPQDKVLIKGWVKTRRDSKDFSFVEVGDGTKQKNMQLTIEEQIVMDVLKTQEAHFDDLAKKTGLDTKKLNSLLTMMEIRGLIKKLAGNYYGI